MEQQSNQQTPSQQLIYKKLIAENKRLKSQNEKLAEQLNALRKFIGIGGKK